MKAKLAHLLSSVFYVGKLPIAPGTWGSLVALIVWYLIIPIISSSTLMGLIVVIFVLGVYVSSVTEIHINKNDPSSVVIDEWVGQWIALLYLPQSVLWGLIGFMLFRLFDIWKPYPIKKFDDLHGGWGIMMDDVLAGIFSLIIVQILRSSIL